MFKTAADTRKLWDKVKRKFEAGHIITTALHLTSFHNAMQVRIPVEVQPEKPWIQSDNVKKRRR